MTEEVFIKRPEIGELFKEINMIFEKMKHEINIIELDGSKLKNQYDLIELLTCIVESIDWFKNKEMCLNDVMTHIITCIIAVKLGMKDNLKFEKGEDLIKDIFENIEKYIKDNGKN